MSVGWFRHAFAVDPPGPAEPTPLQQPAVDWLCIQIAKRHLTTPGLIFLEMSRPLNYIGAQAMHVFQPGVWALASQTSYEGYIHFSKFLEHRGSTEYIARRVEHFESEFTRLQDEKEPVGPFIAEHLKQVQEASQSYQRGVQTPEAADPSHCPESPVE